MRFPAIHATFRSVVAIAYCVCVALARSAEPAANFPSTPHIVIVAPRPAHTQSRRALEADQLKNTDLPLNNVLSILAVELDVLHAEHNSTLDKQAGELFQAYQNEHALLASAALKIDVAGRNSAERLEISRHNARVAEYGSWLREIPHLSDQFATAAQAAENTHQEIGRQLASDAPYQANIDQLNSLRDDIFDSIHELAIAHNESITLAAQAASLRNGYKKGDSTLGRKRTELLANVQKDLTEKEISIEQLSVSLQAHKKENIDWDAAQRKHSQELLDLATKKVNDFNSALPILSKANDKLKIATDSLNAYLASSGGKPPTDKSREFNRRKKALTTAETNVAKARQTLDAAKAAAENAKAAVDAFVNSWNAEARNRAASLQKEADDLKSQQNAHDFAPDLAQAELRRLDKLVETQAKPFEAEANRKKAWCVERFGERYETVLDAANEWLTGRAAASDCVVQIDEAWADLARKIKTQLSQAAELENAQARIFSDPRFAALNFQEKEKNARAVWKKLENANHKAAVLKEALESERPILMSKLRSTDEPIRFEDRNNSFLDSLNALQHLSNQKRKVSDAEYSVARNIFEFVIGSTDLDGERVKVLATEKNKFDADHKSWLEKNSLPISAALAGRFETWRKANFFEEYRSPISTDDNAAFQTGDVPRGVAVETWGKIKADDWQRAVAVWFKNLEEREDGVFLIEKQLARAIADQPKRTNREFLNGLMQRAFAREASAQVLRFANRQGATLVQRTESGRRFALTPFWSLKPLPQGTAFEKELIGDLAY
jgi:hypothetical protein